MFTGIVSECGEIRKVKERDVRAFEIAAPVTSGELSVGDSVAVEGVCLTATRVRKRRFIVEAVPETLARTTLARLGPGDPVNLELAARLNDRMGGHLVQGHVDGRARLESASDDGGSTRLRFSLDPAIGRYMVEKGSVTLSGVSLTISGCGRAWFEVALIPHTSEVTTLGTLREGDEVNVEVDILAKYVERLLQPSHPEGV